MEDSEFVCRQCSDNEVCTLKLTMIKSVMEIGKTEIPDFCPWGNAVSAWKPLKELG